MNATRTLHYGTLEKGVKTQAKSLFWFTPLAPNYRFLENSHAKRLSYKHCEGEIFKKLYELHKNRGRINVLRMRPLSRKRYNESECNPCQGNATQAVKWTPVEETLQSCQNATPVVETPHKRSKCDPCRGNDTEVVKRQFLLTKSRFSDQNTITVA